MIKFNDGTQYCVEDDEKKIYNQSEAFWRQSERYRYDDLVYLFNRLIDPNEVSSVEVEAMCTGKVADGDDYKLIYKLWPFVFYPE